MTPALPTLGSYFILRESVVVVPAVGFIQLCKNDPNRVAVVFCAVDGKQVSLAMNPALLPTGSFTLGNAANASVQNIVFDFQTYGAMSQSAWNGTSGTGVAQNVGVIEVVWMPPGGEE